MKHFVRLFLFPLQTSFVLIMILEQIIMILNNFADKLLYG